MNDDLKESFDGYLTFDFSNFHAMMAQAYEEEAEEVVPLGKQRKPDIPGPYLESPQQVEKESKLINQIDQGDIHDHVYFDENDDNISYSHYSNFNLLANLDFEPEDEDIQLRKSSRCTKKVSLFSPSMQYEDENQKINMINIQNIDMLKEDYDLDDFYRFLTTLDFLNVQTLQQSDQQDNSQAITHLIQIRQSFERLFELFSQKTLKYQSLSFTNKLSRFQQILEEFVGKVNAIVDKREQKDNAAMMSVTFFKGTQLMELFRALLNQKVFLEGQKKLILAQKTLRSHFNLQRTLIRSKGCYVTLFKRDKDQRSSLTIAGSSLTDWSKLQFGDTTLFCRNKTPNRPIFIGLSEYFKQISENKIQEAKNMENVACIYQGIKRRTKQSHLPYLLYKEDDDYYQL